jgi:hypothetical protein
MNTFGGFSRYLPGALLRAEITGPSRVTRLAILWLAFFAMTVSALAQSTFGSIRGTVTDATGAAVPGATTAIVSVEQGSRVTGTTDNSGAFLFENLKAGTYSMTVEHTGFASTKVTTITLGARQDIRLALTLQIASSADTVEVSGSADQINTEDATIADDKNNALITELPLNNRASTTSPLGALSLSANVQQDSSGYIALGGASSSMVNFSVDGVSTVNVRQNGALQDAYPSQEGIAGVKVTAFNNSAEFSQVGDVTFTTKAGSKNFHGSLFEYLQNNALDASPYGFSGKAPKHFNTFGGSLGGPVAIPHLYSGKSTFFFLDYEGNRRSTATLQQFLVPTLADRAGNLSDICGPTITNINPTAAALLKYYPLPNQNVALGCGSGVAVNYENFQSTPSRTDGADLRIDQTLGSKNSLYGRFSRKNISSDVANPFLPNDVDSVHNRSLLVSDTYTITPKLLNEARFGLTYVTTSVNFPIAGASALTQLALTGVDLSQHPLTHAFPTFNFNAGTGFTPIGRDKAGVTQSHTTQISDNLTWTVGRHTFKGGTDIRRLRYFDLESFAPEFNSDDFGNFVFQSTFTGNAFGDFLMGEPTTEFFAVSSPDVGGTATQYSFFAQDEYQVNSRLTLSYGLRWQVLPSFAEDGGNLANFDQYNNAIVVPDNLAAYLQQQNIVSSNVAFQQSFNSCTIPGRNTNLACTQYLTASQDHLPQGLRQTYLGNVQPRIAFAYRPFNDTKTVVRGGFGVYTITNLGPLSFNNSGNPTSNLHVYANSGTAAAPLIQFPNTAPPSSGATFGGGGLDQGVDPHYRDPQANQWSLTVERQLNEATSLRASYVGMHSYRLSITQDLNQIPASTVPYDSGATAGPFVDSRAPYQNWSTLYSTFNAGKANYHAVELQATHRMGHGLYYDANYTWASNRADNQGDTPSGFAGEVNYGVPVADRFHIGNNYGNEEGTRRHRMLLNGVYQLPFGEGRMWMAGHNWVSRILGGWDLNTVTLLETGPWLTPSISPGGCQAAVNTAGQCPTNNAGIPETNDQSNTNITNRGATLRPDAVSSHFYTGQSRTQYFNINAFAATPVGAGRFGNAGVGILQGPGTAAVAMGLAKTFAINDALHLRFESTFTNVLNHTNFAPPATQIDNTSTFGQLTAATTAENAGNRTGQVALRLDF